MPGTGYDEEAMKIGGLRGGRPRGHSILIRAIFLAAIAFSAGIAWLFK